MISLRTWNVKYFNYAIIKKLMVPRSLPSDKRNSITAKAMS